MPIDEDLSFAPERGAMVTALDALAELAKFDERKAVPSFDYADGICGAGRWRSGRWASGGGPSRS